MLVKIIKPIPGLGYFGNEVAELDTELAATWIERGYMILVPEVEGEINELPAELPCRDALFDAGLKTVADIINAGDEIREIKGIGKKTAEEIKLLVRNFHSV